ncbi:MAG: DUF481 domain-containing protein [Spirosomataceae bacterium]
MIRITTFLSFVFWLSAGLTSSLLAQDTSRVQIPMRADSLTITPSDSTDNTEEGSDDPESDEISTLLAKGWSYSVSLSGDFKTGNVQRSLLSISTFLNYESKTTPWGFYTSPRLMKGSINGEKAEDELFLDLNSTLFYDTHDVYGLLFGIYESSNLRKINERIYVGAGLGFRVIGGLKHPNAPFKLIITQALLHENTDFITKADISTWRSSTRVRTTFKFWKGKMELSNTTFLQPALDQNNFRWNAVSQVSIALAKHLSFVINEINSYESVVVEGASNTDFSLTLGFVFMMYNKQPVRQSVMLLVLRFGVC